MSARTRPNSRRDWDRHLATQFLAGQSVVEVAVENSMRPDAVEAALRRELKRRRNA